MCGSDFKILARHKWVAGAVIAESVNQQGVVRRFTATIRGFRNWKIYQGPPSPCATSFVIAAVQGIRDRIDARDETVFDEPNEYAEEATWEI